MIKSQKSETWQFLPIMILAFNYPVNINILGLIIPIYFLEIGISSQLNALLSAGTTITYIFSPLLLNKLSERLSRKNSILIAMGGTLIAQMIFFFTLNPIPFLISRLIEGFFIGLYWTNIQSCISDNVYHNHKKLIFMYQFSWNAGSIFGFLFGAIISFFFKDILLLFLISPIFVFINFILIIFFFQEPEKANIDSIDKSTFNTEQIPKSNEFFTQNLEKKKINHEFNEISFPLLYPILLLVAFCLTRGVIGFIFPIKSVFLNFELSTVYIATLFLGLSQIISMTFISLFQLKTLKKITQINIFVLAILMFLVGLNTNYFIFIILFLFIGFCTGTLYGLVLRLIINLNMKKKTSKYSSGFESLIASSFFISSIVSGFIIDIELNLMFYILSILFLIITFITIILINKRIKL